MKYCEAAVVGNSFRSGTVFVFPALSTLPSYLQETKELERILTAEAISAQFFLMHHNSRYSWARLMLSNA